MDKLHNYLLHYNTYRGVWAAIPRGKESEYFNDMTSRVTTGILYAEDVNTLVEFLTTKKEDKVI